MTQPDFDLAGEMARFYDRHRDVPDPEAFGRAYVDHFMMSGLSRAMSNGELRRHTFGVSLLAPAADLASLTKKSLLIADRLVISQNDPNASSSIRTSRAPASRDSEMWTVTKQRITGISLAGLSSWLRACEPLARSARAIYFPNVVSSSALIDESLGQSAKDVRRPSHAMLDLVVNQRGLIDTAPNALVGSTLVRPLLATEIPYVEGTSLQDFCAIADSEMRSFGSLQRHLREELLSIGPLQSDAEFRWAGARLANSAQQAVNEIQSDLKRVVRRNAVQAAGAALAIVTATLVAVDPSVVAEVAAAAGVSGGAWGLVSRVEDILDHRKQIADRPFYFFWLLEKHAKSG